MVCKYFDTAAVPERECGSCLVFALYCDIRLTAEEESWKNLSQGSRNMPAGHDSISRIGGRFAGRLGSLSNLRRLCLVRQVTG